jgi:hypothetical protein
MDLKLTLKPQAVNSTNADCPCQNQAKKAPRQAAPYQDALEFFHVTVARIRGC